MRIKLYSLLLLLAPLFLSSYKIDNSKNVIVKKNKFLALSKSYTVNDHFTTGSSEVGYYTVPINATFGYFTLFGSPNKNVITSINNFQTSHSESNTIYDPLGSTEFSISCTLDNSNVVITSDGGYGSVSLIYHVTLTKTVRRHFKPDLVITNVITENPSISLSSSGLEFEIEY